MGPVMESRHGVPAKNVKGVAVEEMARMLGPESVRLPSNSAANSKLAVLKADGGRLAEFSAVLKRRTQ